MTNDQIKDDFFVPELLACTTVGWSLLYYILQKLTKQTDEWNCRVVTIFHGFLVTILSVYDWYHLQSINPWTIEALGQLNTKYEETVLCVTLGYFIFDFFWVFTHRTEGPLMYCHHISSIISISYILYCERSAPEALLSLSILEGTNPCLQIRWFLRSHGYYGKWQHTTTECIFMISFLLLRIVYGTYLTYMMITSNKLAATFKMGIFSLYMVSLIFLFQMVTYVFKKYYNKID